MKKLLPFLIVLFMASFVHAQQEARIYIVIDGIPATDEAYEKVQNDSTVVMHFLPPAKAVPLYGPVAAKGALLITTGKAESATRPVFFREGSRIDPDSLDYSNVQRIDVIRGRQAINLYGPAGKDGVYLLHEEEKPTVDVILRLTDKKGNPVKRGKVMSENGSILAESDKCGWVILENFSLGKTVTISTGKNKTTQLVITRQVMNVKL